MSFESKRQEKMQKGKMRVVAGDVDGLFKLFADKSYAVTKEGHFVPLIPRHMTNENWRELFWLQPRKVLIHGQVYKSMCSICMSALECMKLKHNWDFECVATTKTMTVDLRGKRRRR